jgi:hypothetical protein
VVMSNHFHLLIEEPDREDLPVMDREILGDTKFLGTG